MVLKILLYKNWCLLYAYKIKLPTTVLGNKKKKKEKENDFEISP